MDKNEKKYPVEKAKGVATKYDKLQKIFLIINRYKVDINVSVFSFCSL